MYGIRNFIIFFTDLLDFSDTDSVSNNDWWMTDIPDSVPNPELEPQPATWSDTHTVYDLISLDDSHDDIGQDDSIFERYVKVLLFFKGASFFTHRADGQSGEGGGADIKGTGMCRPYGWLFVSKIL